jgi:serine/threonine protein kinase
MAPETIINAASTTKIDMWALGIILYQLFSNKHPFEGPNFYETMKLIRESEPAPLPSNLSTFIRKLIEKLLDKNPDNRPSPEELFSFKEIRDHIN